MPLNPEPKASVFMISYNHERYIAPAIQSVFAQRCSFPIEIVLGDDCSTDRTLAIARKLALDAPVPVKILAREQNLGMMRNATETYAACAGEYVAFLEGDDFWTDSSKLQRQLELLESNPSASMCVHATSYVAHSGRSLPTPWPRPAPSEFAVEHFLKLNPVHTSSMLVRRSMLPILPTYLSQLKLGDWPICILLALQGACLVIDEQMSSYRVHPAGGWSSKDLDYRQNAVLDMFLTMLVHHPEHYSIFSRAIKDIANQERILRESLSCRLGFALTLPFRAFVSQLRRDTAGFPQ
jgi:glycosyltransferase involved in cell wall biosynthesis